MGFLGLTESHCCRHFKSVQFRCNLYICLQNLTAEAMELKRHREITEKQVKEMSVNNAVLQSEYEAMKEDFDLLKKTQEEVVYTKCN